MRNWKTTTKYPNKLYRKIKDSFTFEDFASVKLFQNYFPKCLYVASGACDKEV